MTVVDVEKINVICGRKQKEQLLCFLRDLHVIYLKETSKKEIITKEASDIREEKKEAELELMLADLKYCIEFLEKYSTRPKGILASFVLEKEIVCEEIYFETFKDFDHQKLVKDCKGFESEITNLVNLQNKLKEHINFLFPWKRLKVRLDSFKNKYFQLTPLIGKEKDFLLLKYKFEKLTPYLHLEPVYKKSGRVFFVVMHRMVDRDKIYDFCRQNSIEIVNLLESNLTPEEEIREMDGFLLSNKKELRLVESEAQRNSQYIPKLHLVHDYLYQKYYEIKNRKKLGHTKYTLIIEGWIKTKDFSSLEDELRIKFPESIITKVEPEKGEVPPTVIENPKPLFPFELITKIFGLPNYFESDPTIPLSFFFTLFFGICLSDVGYGLSLFLLSLYLVKKLRIPTRGKSLLFLLAIGGIVSTAIGLITGSYFGFNITEAPAYFDFLKQIKMLDPIKNPLTLLMISLFLGIFQILFGLSFKMFNNFRNKKFVQGLLDQGSWVLFLSSIVVWIVTANVNPALRDIFRNSTIVFTLLLIFTQGRHQKNVFMKFLSGILSLYRSTSFLGDALSYSRLLALMMTTSIIGMVVNIIALLVKDSVPILGYFIMALILIFGHLFNLIISTLGAFVHSLRLQLVEFFSKFYEDGGVEFRPYKKETKYTIIKVT